MTADIIGYVSGAIAVLGAAIIAARATVRSNRITAEATKAVKDQEQVSQRMMVVASAYDQAQRINAGIVQDLRSEIQRLQRELNELRKLLRQEQTASSDLRKKLASLQSTVDRMQALLKEHQITLPTNP